MEKQYKFTIIHVKSKPIKLYILDLWQDTVKFLMRVPNVVYIYVYRFFRLIQALTPGLVDFYTAGIKYIVTGL